MGEEVRRLREKDEASGWSFHFLHSFSLIKNVRDLPR